MTKPSTADVAEFFDAVVSLYHRLNASAMAIHARGALSGPRRTVLRVLATGGAQTVSALARSRGQARQRFQPLVNHLLAEGLVEARSNPSHKQSPLIALTRKGERVLAAAVKRETVLLEALDFGVSQERLKQSTAVAETVREGLEVQLPKLLRPTRSPRRATKSSRR